MLPRLRRLLSRGPEATPIEAHWQLNHRVEHLYRLHAELQARLADDMAAAAAGYLRDFQHRIDDHERELESLVAALRRHTEEAAGAAERSAILVAHEHANAAVAHGVDVSITASREHTEAALAAMRPDAVAEARGTAIADAARHTEELIGSLRLELLEEMARVRRFADSARTRIAAAPSQSHAAEALDPAPDASIDASFYVALEDHFRGSRALIVERQRQYVPVVREFVDDDHPLLDLGCGRGEWLSVLRESGLSAYGVDANHVTVAECLEAGLKVHESDLSTALASTATGSLGAVSMFQVVEHLPFPLLLETFRQCARVLRPGGLLLVETPNALNLQVAATTFWLDPTHQRPLHPELLRLIAKEAGFARSESMFTNRMAGPEDVSMMDDRTAQLLGRVLEMVDGPGDYVMLAWAPRAS